MFVWVHFSILAAERALFEHGRSCGAVLRMVRAMQERGANIQADPRGQG